MKVDPDIPRVPKTMENEALYREGQARRKALQLPMNCVHPLLVDALLLKEMIEDISNLVGRSRPLPDIANPMEI